MKLPENGILQLTTNYTPVQGSGARISPATYAGDSSKGILPGPAFSENIPHATLTEDGDIKTGQPTRAVIIDSIWSQSTRAENALWELRKELSLPGIVLREGDPSLIDKNVNLKKTDSSNIEYFKQSMKLADESSSWNFPHRHVDGIVRWASLTPDGKTPVWNPAGKEPTELQERIFKASPQNVNLLLNMSPNSIIYGYWLSTGAPINHKIPRSYSHEIVGYGVNKVSYGATKISQIPTSAQSKTTIIDYATGKEVEKKPSEMLLGSVPAYSTANVTAETILGRGSILLGQLRSVLRQDKSMSKKEQELAFQALAHLALLGHLQQQQDWTLRSECTLIPDKMFWALKEPGKAFERIEIPSVQELLQDTIVAVSEAQSAGVFGTESDIVNIYSSKELIDVAVKGFIPETSNKDSNG